MSISRSVRRTDALEKGSASARYIADMEFAGMIYARTLRADRPRARILSIDVPLFHAPWGGLRYEDGYLITESGAELLGDFPSGVLTV